MLESLSPGQRGRTGLFLASFAVLGAGAAVVGIDDNPLGIALVMLSAASLVLAFVHSWRTSRQYWRLTYISVLGFVAFLILGIALQALVELTSMAAPIDTLLEIVGTALLLGAGFLCVPGALVGLGGIVLMRRRERKLRPKA